MATVLPRPPLPPYDPPTTALPPLPISKSRKSLPTLPESPRSPSALQRPSKLAIRTPSRSTTLSLFPKAQHANSTPTVPTLRTTSTALHQPPRELRKSVSIAAFPQPPKTKKRPVAMSRSPSSAGSPASTTSDSCRRLSGESNSLNVLRERPRPKKLKVPNAALTYSSALSNSPSLLNGNGDGKLILGGPGTRGSDGLLSLNSPSHSRSSSAQGSYSTTATTFEDVDDNPKRGRDVKGDAAVEGKHRSKTFDGKGNVVVSVRVRPDVGGSGSAKSDGEWMVDGRKSLVSYRGRESGDYYYDNVFATHDRNDKIYDASAKRLVRRVMEGYHGTVFAYGMTGTGKTFSMQGTTASPGVIPLAITDIFSYIRETPRREFLLRVSYLEIYNEKIHDLLSLPTASGVGSGASQPEEIKLREDGKRGVYASPLKEEIVQSPTQLLRVIARGDQARRTGSTQYNTRSSRSHAVVQIVVESRERVMVSGTADEDKRAPMEPGGVRVSTLSLIDLAGSERAAENKDRRTEGAHINKSLLTLGTVIARLSGDKDKSGNPTDKDGKHLPYRDSKLTRLLQPALSGDSLVSILCTIQIGSAGSAAAANSHTGETLNTLKFAARAKNNIVSHAKKVEEAFAGGADAGSIALLEHYRMEIQSLRGQLEGQARIQAEKEEKQLEKKAEQRHEEQMLEMQLARTALKERIEHLNRLILSSKSIGVNTSGTFSSLSMHPKLAAYSSAEAGTKSMRSSTSLSTIGPPSLSLHRTTSGASSRTIEQQSSNPQPGTQRFDIVGEEDDALCNFSEGTAPLQQQNRALQADLADKTRYIATLEKRLLQARRSSSGRNSNGFSPPSHHISVSVSSNHGKEDNSGLASSLREKDLEIEELRTQIKDKDRMLSALRSAVRNRDLADSTPPRLPSQPVDPSRHQSSDSNGSSDRSALSLITPVGLLSPSQKNKGADMKRKSIDEMSRILDEMIQDRVESGQLVRGGTGSVRVKTERMESWGDGSGLTVVEEGDSARGGNIQSNDTAP